RRRGARAHLREVLTWPADGGDIRRRPRPLHRALARGAARRFDQLRGCTRWRRDLRAHRASRHGMKVLIVDDEPDVRALVSTALGYTQEPAEVLEAADGDE